MKVYETLAKNVLPPLVTMASVSTIDVTIQKKKKNAWKWFCKNRKSSHLVISIEDMNNTIRIIKSQENSGVLSDGVSETRVLQEQEEYIIIWTLWIKHFSSAASFKQHQG